MGNTYFALQTILDKNDSIAGYEILYRGDNRAFSHDEDTVKTSTVISELINVCGAENILGPYLGFIKVNAFFLEHDFIQALPPEHFVFSVFEEDVTRPDVQEAVIVLASEGYLFAVNDLKSLPLPDNKAFLDALSYVKIDAHQLAATECAALVQTCRRHKISVVASKVESHAILEAFRQIETGFFQGYYLGEPVIHEGATISAEAAAIMTLWNLVREEADTDKLVDAFQQNHSITLQLLRFINSAYFNLRNTIKSIRQVITLLGKDQLSQWLMLMLLSQESKKENINHPLLLMALNRTEIMTGLLGSIHADADRREKETAYLVGMLSMIHLLFHMQHREFLRHLHVSDEIEEAMFEAKGFFGQLLTAVRDIENNNIDRVEAFIHEHHLKGEEINRLVIEARKRVNDFEAMMMDI